MLSPLEGQCLYVYSFLIKGHVEKQETEISFTLLHKKAVFREQVQSFIPGLGGGCLIM